MCLAEFARETIRPRRVPVWKLLTMESMHFPVVASHWLGWGCSLFPELLLLLLLLDGLWWHLAQVQRRLTPRHRQRVWREALVSWPKKELGEIPLFFLPSSSIPVRRQSWGVQVQLDRYPESRGRNLLSDLWSCDPKRRG